MGLISCLHCFGPFKCDLEIFGDKMKVVRCKVPDAIRTRNRVRSNT